MLFDTHAHLDDPQFNEDREQVIDSLASYGVTKVTNIGADLATSRAAVRLAETYPFLYAAVGVHPSETTGMTDELSLIHI